MLPTLCKTLDPADYAHLQDEVARIGHAHNLFAGLFDDAHPHRTWEYAIALAALGGREDVKGKEILDVGGGPSPLGGILAWSGAQVTVIDLGDNRAGQEDIGHRAAACSASTPGGSLRFVQADFTSGSSQKFDAVFCTSTIEHVPEHHRFFQSLLNSVRPGGLFVLTTDFHPSGSPQCEGHLRTYNSVMLTIWAATPGTQTVGPCDYIDRGCPVNGYNFASLVLRRVP